MITIKSIKINSLRGIKEFELPLDGKGLLLFGENGTGKSSIVDAIEFFFTGSISHLRSAQSLSLRGHGTHARSSPSDVRVTLEFNPGGTKLTRTFTSVFELPEQYKNFFQIAQKGIFILRRSQIMDFIHSKPAERFGLISNILGFEYLDNFEEALNAAVHHFAETLESTDEEKSSVLKELSAILSGEIQDINSVLDILNDRLTKLNLEPLASVDDIDDSLSNMFKRLGNAQDEVLTDTLNKICEKASSVIVGEDIKRRMKEVSMTLDSLLEEHLTKIRFIGLLKEGKQILIENETSKCPLCEHNIDKTKVLVKIKKNLVLLTGISDKASKIKEDCLYIINGLQKIKLAIDEFSFNLQIYETDFAAEIHTLNEISRSFEDLTNTLNLCKDLLAKIDYNKFKTSEESLRNAANKSYKKAEDLLHNIKSDNDENLIYTINLLKDTKSKLVELKTINNDIEMIRSHLSISNRIRTLYLTTKHLKIQEIHDYIQKDVERFYSIIHPNEDHSNIKLMVDLSKKGSTILQVNSYNKAVDPRAFESEGHLDSLGLCIFLAFIKRFNTECSLVILDDIVTTIDASHRVRICKLLYEYFKDKQLIITTHDSIWYDQLVANQRTFGLQGKFENKIIAGWNILEGPILLGFKPTIEKIREKLDSGDKTGAANGIRQYLEWLLKEICEAIKAEVPFRGDGRYGVGDLLIPSKKRVAKLAKNREWEKDILTKYADLEAAVPIANLLSHDNADAGNISKSEIQNLFDAVCNLHHGFQCTTCQELLQYVQLSGHLQCINDKCKNPTSYRTT